MIQMGFVDRWLKRFLTSATSRSAVFPSDEQVLEQGLSSAGQANLPETSGAGFGRHGQPATQATGAAVAAVDHLDERLRQARACLTLDAAGKYYVTGAEFQAHIAALDQGGRRKAADELLADAILCSPSSSLRRQLAERLLHRGERVRARGLLEALASTEEHAVYATFALGELFEAEGDVVEATSCFERVLALDVTHERALTRVRRLKAVAGQDHGTDDARASLARFLGARAAGARYAVVDEVGRGGAATVFRARDRRLARDVALKVFHPRGRKDERRRRLLQEAHIAGSFDHPHVVPVLDLDDEREMLVMVLCDGGSLQKTLQGQGKLRTHVALELGAVLLRTLADVHDAGHLHLDIKPSNLLFHSGRLMICDFGTAGLNELGAAAGTRAYMAPEAFGALTTGGASLPGDVPALGPKADLFAAGLVVAEAIEGRLPRRGAVVLPTIAPGPRRRALERVLSLLTAEDPQLRPADGRVAADLLLQAGALPLGDDEGAQLATHIEMLARREGDDAIARAAAHPLVGALRAG
jgi:tRNA A-37 threonylcarbamoyl transferase component Bud32